MKVVRRENGAQDACCEEVERRHTSVDDREMVRANMAVVCVCDVFQRNVRKVCCSNFSTSAHEQLHV